MRHRRCAVGRAAADAAGVAAVSALSTSGAIGAAGTTMEPPGGPPPPPAGLWGADEVRRRSPRVPSVPPNLDETTFAAFRKQATPEEIAAVENYHRALRAAAELKAAGAAHSVGTSLIFVGSSGGSAVSSPRSHHRARFVDRLFSEAMSLGTQREQSFQHLVRVGIETIVNAHSTKRIHAAES